MITHPHPILVLLIKCPFGLHNCPHSAPNKGLLCEPAKRVKAIWGWPWAMGVVPSADHEMGDNLIGVGGKITYYITLNEGVGGGQWPSFRRQNRQLAIRHW
jgi:hypothetical protein